MAGHVHWGGGRGADFLFEGGYFTFKGTLSLEKNHKAGVLYSWYRWVVVDMPMGKGEVYRRSNLDEHGGSAYVICMYVSVCVIC